MKKSLIVMAILLTGILLNTSAAQARGRTGSIRIGGYTSHGKGSHYIGGYLRTGPSLRTKYR